MPSFNRVTLVGNLTRDPESRELIGANNGTTKITEFGLAVSRKYRTSSGEDREEVLFIDCTAFGKPAETLGQFCRKGRLLLVEGRLKLDAWEEKLTGARRSKISVIVENFQFLGRDSADESSRDAIGRQQTFRKEFEEREKAAQEKGKDESAPAPAPRRGRRATAPAAVVVKDDDIPF